MATLPYVFIGSSTKGLDFAKAIQQNLDGICECTIWHQGVFGLSDGTLESLEEVSNIIDFAILVVTGDDLTISDEEEKKSPRDNVVFEIGFFMGKLERQRVFIVVDKSSKLKLPTDLAGITVAKFQRPIRGNLRSALGPSCTDIENKIKILGLKLNVSITRASLNHYQVLDKYISNFNKITTRSTPDEKTRVAKKRESSSILGKYIIQHSLDKDKIFENKSEGSVVGLMYAMRLSPQLKDKKFLFKGYSLAKMPFTKHAIIETLERFISKKFVTEIDKTAVAAILKFYQPNAKDALVKKMNNIKVLMKLK